MSEIEKAIKILREEYEKAVKRPQVYNPIAYALYHTWRQFDRRKEKKINALDYKDESLPKSEQSYILHSAEKWAPQGALA